MYQDRDCSQELSIQSLCSDHPPDSQKKVNINSIFLIQTIWKAIHSFSKVEIMEEIPLK